MPDFDVRVDYYEILQVHPKAELAVIRSAYRAILKELQAHPDLGGSHERAVLINDAYRVLKNADLRKDYDRERQRHARVAPAAPPGPRRAAAKSGEPVNCPACGRKNRLRADIDKDKAACGVCKAKLFPNLKHEIVPPGVSADDNRLQIAPTLYAELKEQGEVELRVQKLPRGGKVMCRRCRRIWTAPARGPVPAACPACGAKDWNAFRLFKCRHCQHEFSSPSLGRTPYLLFQACPSCNQTNWHIGKEAKPLSGIFKFLKG